MSDGPFLTNAGSWAAAPPAAVADCLATMDAIRARLDARREADDRKVYRFDGTLAEFKAALARGGAEILEARDAQLALAQLEGLQVRVFPGFVLAGTREAFDRLFGRDRVEPFTLDEPGSYRFVPGTVD